MYLKIYTADTKPLKDQAVMDRLIRLVPAERQKKTVQRAQPDDRTASLAAGLLLSLATERMGLPGADEYIKYNGYGKPYYDLAEYEHAQFGSPAEVHVPECADGCDGGTAENAAGDMPEQKLSYAPHTAIRPSHVPQVYFNISHSHDRVMCVVSDMEVGCDVELIRPEAMRLASHMLHPEETELFDDLMDEKERQRFFFRRWTAKESYVKATGTGYTGIMPKALRVMEEHFELSVHVDAKVEPDSMAPPICSNSVHVDAEVEPLIGGGTSSSADENNNGSHAEKRERADNAVSWHQTDAVRSLLSEREAMSRFYEWDLYDGYRYACCVLAPDEETLEQLPDEEPELIEIDLAEEF